LADSDVVRVIVVNAADEIAGLNQTFGLWAERIEAPANAASETAAIRRATRSSVMQKFFCAASAPKCQVFKHLIVSSALFLVQDDSVNDW
jgi:hypothetical protein